MSRIVETHPLCLWLFWPLCTFHAYKLGSQRLKNQQSNTLHKTSQIQVWNPVKSGAKFTRVWTRDRFQGFSLLSFGKLLFSHVMHSGLVLVWLMTCLNDPWPGGVSPSERGLVWRFLFGMYPCSSTALERSLLQEQLVVRYRVMKRKWQRFLPSAVRMHLNGTDGKSPNMQTVSQ